MATVTNDNAAPPESASITAAGRILVLEDDDDLKEIIINFLRLQQYEVVGVCSGVDGIKEVQAGDFEVIICDMMMPSIPGDMFYLAVERMRPQLCSRFVFITGERSNDHIRDFIKKVNGLVLAKPFQVSDLLEIVRFVQLRNALHPH